MKLIIRLENNQPVDHPILFDNFLMIAPDADYDNLPEGFAKFVRIPKPDLGPFKFISPEPDYVWENDIVTDRWTVTDMPEDEKNTLLQRARDAIPFPSWTLDEERLRFIPPVDLPQDGFKYDWDETNQTWVKAIPE